MLKKAFFTHLLFSAIFFCQGQQIKTIEYFFDVDPGMGNGNYLSITPAEELNKLPVSVSLSELEPGIHQFYVRALDSEGKWSLTSYKPFAFETVSLTRNIVTVEYALDNDPGPGMGTKVNFTPAEKVSKLTFSAELPELSPGFHNFYIRAQDSDGHWSLIANRPFLHESALSDANNNIVYMEYFIDDDPGFHNGQEITFTPTPELAEHSFNIDLTDVPLGPHNVFIRTLDKKGNWSLVSIASFEKSIATGNIGIITPDQDIEVFPNPSSAAFNIQATNQEKPSSILVLDNTGKVILDLRPNEVISSIDLSDNPAGTYFIKVVLQEKTVYRKVVKE